MDGYSVQEAATVLGVAEGRVWELLARGVLAGTPEGDSMRVFLKSTASPSPGPGPRDEPPRTNGNGGSHGNGGELSAFREVLTEFRNLTERYGQALLALGEARGEVAGLRSRVELLEARLDLRLPPARDDGPIAWGTAAASAPAPEPPVPASVEAVMPAPAPVRQRPRPRPRKARSKKIAMTGFADALARAEDPSAADVGGALAAVDLAAEPIEYVATEPIEDVAAEHASDVIETEIEPAAEFLDTSEASTETEAQEEASADARDEAADSVGDEPEAEALAPTYSATVVEPDWFADGDFAWLDAADVEARGQPEPTAPVSTEGEAEVAPLAEADLEPEPMTVAEAEPSAEQGAYADPAPAAEVGPEPMTVAEAEVAPAAEADFEPEPMTVAEAEPSAEQEAYADPAPAAEVEPAFETAAEPDPEIEPMTVAEAEPAAEQEAYPDPAPAAEPFAEQEAYADPASAAELQPPTALEPEPVFEPEPFIEQELSADPAPMPTVEPEPFIEQEPDVDLELLAHDEPNPITSIDSEFSVEPEVPVGPSQQAESVDLVEPEPEPDIPGPVALAQRAPDSGFHSPGSEEEVMWIGEDRQAAAEMESASRASQVPPTRWDTAESGTWPAADTASLTADVVRPPLAMTEEELAQLARDEGWNDAEVAAIRAMIWRPGSPTGGLPGADELDEAIAALDAVPVEPANDNEPPREWAKNAPADDEPPTYEDWTFELDPALDPLPPARTVPRRPGPDPSPSRRRRGPAATAYRRLRRLFPS